MTIIRAEDKALAELLEPVRRMSRDIRAASVTLSDQEARYLVDAYYQMQDDRIRADHRSRQMQEMGEPNLILQWLGEQSSTLEQQIKGALDKYTYSRPIGEWLRGIKGIGPVISAGLIANIDIKQCNTAGKLWAYCGMAPGRDKRVRGQKLGFNPAMKRIAFLAGESFKRLSSDDPAAYYRHWYDKRKTYETAKNERLEYADQAAAALAAKKYDPKTEAYKAYAAGKLPLARIDRRAARWSCKLFLSHMQAVWWEMETGEKPPAPFPIAIMGHVDYVPPPI